MARAKTTAVLFAAAVVLTAWFGVFERGKLGRELDPGRLFFRLLREDLERITIERKQEETVVLERVEGDRWQLSSPLTYDVERGRIDTLLRAIVFLKANVVVSEEAQNAFPKGGPRTVLHFSAQGEEHTVLIGNSHLTKDLVYYRVEDKMFLGRQNLKQYCERSIDEWRDKGVCPVMPDNAGYVEVEGAGKTIVMERSPEGVWFIRKPVQYRGDPGMIQEFIKAFSVLSVKEFYTPGKDTPLASFGLEQPKWRFRIRKLEGIRDYEILVGDTIPSADPPEIYIKRTDRSYVFRCEDTVSKYLKLGPADLHDRRVVPFEDYGWVKRISFRGGKVDFSLMRAAKESDWTLVDKKRDLETRSPAKRGGRLVDACRNLLIGEFVPDAHIGAEQLRVTLDIQDRSEPMVLIFGEEVEEGVFLGRRKGVEGEGDIVFKFPSRLPYEVVNTAIYEDLVRKTIKEDNLQTFTLRTKKGRWALVRLMRWQVDGRPEVEIDPAVMQKAVDFLCRPTASFYEPDPGPLKELGLQREYSRLRVAIPKTYGKYSYYELLVGREVGAGNPLSYMKIDTDHVVFIADPTPMFNLVDHIAEQGE